MNILVRLTENLKVPSKSTPEAVGYDLIATSGPKIVGRASPYSGVYYDISYIEYETNLYIACLDRVHIGTLSANVATLILPRSSISKYNLVLANGIGLIDPDFRGQVLCRYKYLWQPSDLQTIEDEYKNQTYGIKVNPNKVYQKGDKISQLVFNMGLNVNFKLVNELPKTVRAEGGFGSTDAKN